MVDCAMLEMLEDQIVEESVETENEFIYEMIPEDEVYEAADGNTYLRCPVEEQDLAVADDAVVVGYEPAVKGTVQYKCGETVVKEPKEDVWFVKKLAGKGFTYTLDEADQQRQIADGKVYLIEEAANQNLEAQNVDGEYVVTVAYKLSTKPIDVHFVLDDVSKNFISIRESEEVYETEDGKYTYELKDADKTVVGDMEGLDTFGKEYVRKQEQTGLTVDADATHVEVFYEEAANLVLEESYQEMYRR